MKQKVTNQELNLTFTSEEVQEHNLTDTNIRMDIIKKYIILELNKVKYNFSTINIDNILLRECWYSYDADASNKCIESVINYSYIVEDDILGINAEFERHKYNTDPNRYQIKAH